MNDTKMSIPQVDSLDAAMQAVWHSFGIENEADKLAFLNPNPTHLIMLDLIPQMGKAKKRIISAIEAEERIIVFGDFDADGVTSTSLLVHGLTQLGAKISYRIPSRSKDSHGLKKHIIDEIKTTGTTLIITVDCGTNNHEEVDHAVALGMDVIITDHHHADPERKPKSAHAIVNPQMMKNKTELKDLAGVGVAFALLRSLSNHYFSKKEAEVFLRKYLELVTIGTIADCMPLVGINRTLCQLGMKEMTESHWPSLKLLINDDKAMTGGQVSFGISPIINAASRLGDVRHAVGLFLGKPETITAKVAYLKNLNEERKRLSKKFRDEVAEKNDLNVNFAYLPDCPVGICGLVAGKLTESTTKPSIIVTKDENGTLSASCRAPIGGELAQALKAAPDLFLSYGGHSQAAGFIAELRNLEAIKAHFVAHYDQKIFTKPTPSITAEILEPEVLKLALPDFLATLEPFGIGAPSPLWNIQNAKLVQKELIGKEKNHLRLLFDFNGAMLSFLGFFMGKEFSTLKQEKQYDLIFEMEASEWNNERRVDLRLREFSPSV